MFSGFGINSMDDLSHWDFAHYFSGHAVAALILGVEPSHVFTTDQRVRVVRERLEQDYDRALKQARNEAVVSIDAKAVIEVKAKRCDSMLKSKMLEALWSDLEDGGLDADMNLLFNKWLPDFRFQKFSRSTVAKWLEAIGVSSKYQFDRKVEMSVLLKQIEDLDPGDYPLELDVAKISYRAVLNGYGNHGETFKSRLINYIRASYPTLKNSEVERIATVANPDKERGRKKSEF